MQFEQVAILLIQVGVGMGLGIALTWAYFKYYAGIPERELWQLNDPLYTSVFIAENDDLATGDYVSAIGGIGLIKAYGNVVSSLNKAYKGLRLNRVYLSKDELGERIERDLILLGNPKNNRVTRMIIEELKARRIVYQKGHAIYWLNHPEIIEKLNAQQVATYDKNTGDSHEIEEATTDESETIKEYEAEKPHSFEEIVRRGKYTPKMEGKEITKDYGLIVRMKNPYAKRHSVCLFSGGFNYGVIAAVRYFTEHYVKKEGKIKKPQNSMVALVECEVLDGYPTDKIKLVKELFFQEEQERQV